MFIQHLSFLYVLSEENFDDETACDGEGISALLSLNKTANNLISYIKNFFDWLAI